MKELDALRREIDRLDAQIAPLLLERFAVVRRIGEVKKTEGIPVLNEAREKAVLDKITSFTEDDKEKSALRKVYKSVMTAAKELEK